LSEVNITNFDSADNVGFAAVIEGTTFPADFLSNGADSSDFLGIALFGDVDNLLEDLSDGLGGAPIIGFDSDVGLVGGVGGTSYTFLVQQNGNNAIDYTFDFILTETESTVSALDQAPTVSSSSSPLFEDLSVSDADITETAVFEAEVEFVESNEVFEDDFAGFADIPDMFEVA